MDQVTEDKVLNIIQSALEDEFGSVYLMSNSMFALVVDGHRTVVEVVVDDDI